MKLLFDFGGVLVDLDKERCIHAFEKIGFDAGRYLGAFKQSGPFSAIERGEMSIPDFCQEVRKLCTNARVTDDEIVKAWQSFLVGVPADRLNMLLKIHQHYSVNVLSNTNAVHWGMASEGYFRYEGHRLQDFFDQVFLSCELGMEKPEKAVFDKVVQELQVEPSEVLFLDDSEANCEAARQCGLKALLAPAGGKWLRYFDEEGRLVASSYC